MRVCFLCLCLCACVCLCFCCAPLSWPSLHVRTVGAHLWLAGVLAPYVLLMENSAPTANTTQAFMEAAGRYVAEFVSRVDHVDPGRVMGLVYQSATPTPWLEIYLLELVIRMFGLAACPLLVVLSRRHVLPFVYCFTAHANSA